MASPFYVIATAVFVTFLGTPPAEGLPSLSSAPPYSAPGDCEKCGCTEDPKSEVMTKCREDCAAKTCDHFFVDKECSTCYCLTKNFITDTPCRYCPEAEIEPGGKLNVAPSNLTVSMVCVKKVTASSGDCQMWNELCPGGGGEGGGSTGDDGGYRKRCEPDSSYGAPKNLTGDQHKGGDVCRCSAPDIENKRKQCQKDCVDKLKCKTFILDNECKCLCLATNTGIPEEGSSCEYCGVEDLSREATVVDVNGEGVNAAVTATCVVTADEQTRDCRMWDPNTVCEPGTTPPAP